MTKGAKARKKLGSARRVLVKIGSRALVSKSGKLDRAVFRSVGDDVAALKEAGKDVALVSSGAILAGRAKLGFLDRALTMPQSQAAAAVGQNALMAEWAKALNKHGLTTGQVLITADDLGDRARYLNARNAMEELLGLGVVPVINENDTVAVDEIRYGDNDHIASLIAVAMRADLMILLTDIDGLCAKDPAASPDAPVLSLVRESDKELYANAGPSCSGVGSGGMATKIEAARAVARLGAPTVIANAKAPGVIGRIVAGDDVGTLFVPEGAPLADKKYWMAFAGEARGKVVVDAGARKASEKRGRSLLPSGVTGVEGEFGKGALVLVVDEKGDEFARGLTQYSASDLALIQGKKSNQIESILGQKLYDEVIHRNYLVLTGKESNGYPT